MILCIKSNNFFTALMLSVSNINEIIAEYFKKKKCTSSHIKQGKSCAEIEDNSFYISNAIALNLQKMLEECRRSLSSVVGVANEFLDRWSNQYRIE